MNDEQYKRYRKVFTEEIECLFCKRDDMKNMHFLVSGSSGTHYKVSIYINGKITCSCPDYKHNARVQECLCKHCLHIVSKIFPNIEHAFYKRRYFTKDEIPTVKNFYKGFKNKLA